MTLLDENGISFEEHLDDLLLAGNVQVYDYPFEKSTAVSYEYGGEKCIALRPRLEEDERVLAKMHEFEHLRLGELYTFETSPDERERTEARIRRCMVEDFLPCEFLVRLICRENTFNPRVLASFTNFSPEDIAYAEHLYFELKGKKAPEIEDAYP